MGKSFCSLGLMSGTSMDGVDASIIQSDGETKYKIILDKYFEYPKDIYEDLTKLRDKIRNSKDLKKFSKEVKLLEKEITLFHAKAVTEILKKTKVNVDFIGFHGQTIYHNATERISKQLGDGKLLSKLTKKTVVYDFRQNDLKHYGEGGPLTPIFHKLLVNQNQIRLPVIILNIGGIANITCINRKKNISSYDIGPGNCLIDEWIRSNSKNKYDKNGKIARSGKVSLKALRKLEKDLIKKFENEKKQLSYDVKDFNLSCVRSLSLKDGAATLTEFTGKILAHEIETYLWHEFDDLRSKLKNRTSKILQSIMTRILVCGGGRKNKTLIQNINRAFSKNTHFLIDAFEQPLEPIDIYNIEGDFVESQAFAYLAIRSYLKLPISFPGTTGVSKPCSGGLIFKN